MHIVAIGAYSMVSCQLFQEETLQERINLTCLISLCILFFKFYLLINSSSLLLCYGSCTHLDARFKKKKNTTTTARRITVASSVYNLQKIYYLKYYT